MILRRRTLLCLIMFLCAAVMVAISPMLQQFQMEYNLTTIQQGMLIMFQFLGYTVFTLAGGVGTVYYSKKTVLGLSLGLIAVALLVLTVAKSFPMLLLGLFFIGGGTGIVDSQVVSMMADTSEINKTFYINFIHAFYGVGALIFPVVIATILQTEYSWKLLYRISAVVCAIVLFFFIRTSYQETKERIDFSLKEVKQLGSNKAFLAICLCMFCYAGAEAGVWGWITTYTEKVIGFSSMASSICLGVFWGMIIIGRFIVGGVSKSISTDKILIVLSGVSVFVTLIIAFATTEAMVWFSVIAMGLTYSAQWPTLTAYGAELCEKNQGVVFAVLTAAGGIGMTVVPYIMGVISQYTNERISMVLPVLLLVAIPVIVLSISKAGENRNPKESAI